MAAIARSAAEASPSWRGWLGGLLLGAAAVGLVHWEQFASRFDRFPAPGGDARLIVYVVEHWYQVAQGRAEVLSPPIFFPVKNTLAYSDLLVAFAPPHVTLRAAGLDPFTAVAVVVVAFNFLNYVAAFGLFYHAMRLRFGAAAAAALFFAFSSPKQTQADHLQLQAMFLLPLIVACLVCWYRRADSPRPLLSFGLLALAAGLLLLQLFTSFYLGWFFVFWSLLWGVLVLALPASRQHLLGMLSRDRWPVAGALAVFLAGFAVFLGIYLPVARATGGWAYADVLRYIPEPRSFLLMADGNLLWDAVTRALLEKGGEGPDWGRRVSIGLVPSVGWLAISVWALTVVWRSRGGRGQSPSEPARLRLALVILAVDLMCLLGLQWEGHSLWYGVYRLFPGGDSLRAVARYVIFLTLPLAMVFAVALDRAARLLSVRRRWWAAAMVGVTVAFGLFEQFTPASGGSFSIRAENERLERLAARLPAECAAFYVVAAPDRGPTGGSFQNQQWMHDAMFVSQRRGVPTLNGRSGKSPRGWWLREVTNPDYEERVRQWIVRHQLRGRICRLELVD